MDYEESIVVREVCRRINQRLHEMNITDKVKAEPIINGLIEDIRIELSQDSSLVPIKVKEQISQQLELQEEDRAASRHLTQVAVMRSFGQQFLLLDRLLAFAELQADRLQETFRGNIKILLNKTPRPDPDAVTGAVLKCLLLLSLYSKMSVIVAEILCLMKENFLDGAESRLRTLHEHFIVATLITNDQTYELSERYQDHAVFEDLKRLRAIRKNVQESLYTPNQDAEIELYKQIALAEDVARRAQARWGANIKEQNEWARPGLLPNAKKKGSIYFTDLELAVGSQFLRPDYLTGNNYIHAGAFAAINHLDFSGRSTNLVNSHNHLLDERMTDIGIRTARYLGWATIFIGGSISTETEQYDEELIAYEIGRAADAAIKSFRDSASLASG